jgi:hypothetical protein
VSTGTEKTQFVVLFAVQALPNVGVTERRACRVVGQPKSTRRLAAPVPTSVELSRTTDHVVDQSLCCRQQVPQVLGAPRVSTPAGDDCLGVAR